MIIREEKVGGMARRLEEEEEDDSSRREVTLPRSIEELPELETVAGWGDVDTSVLQFLSHTPPEPGSSYDYASKRGRVRGPRAGTLERQDAAHSWGGRDDAELSSSFQDMQLGGVRSPRSSFSPRALSRDDGDEGNDRNDGDGTKQAVTTTPQKGPRREEEATTPATVGHDRKNGKRRLQAVLDLETRGAIDDAQKNAIKDCLILGSNAELHAALDHFRDTGDAERVTAFLAQKQGASSPDASTGSLGFLFAPGRRPLSGASIDSDELESVAAAAAIAASAVGSYGDDFLQLAAARHTQHRPSFAQVASPVNLDSGDSFPDDDDDDDQEDEDDDEDDHHHDGKHAPTGGTVGSVVAEKSVARHRVVTQQRTLVKNPATGKVRSQWAFSTDDAAFEMDLDGVIEHDLFDDRDFAMLDHPPRSDESDDDVEQRAAALQKKPKKPRGPVRSTSSGSSTTTPRKDKKKSPAGKRKGTSASKKETSSAEKKTTKASKGGTSPKKDGKETKPPTKRRSSKKSAEGGDDAAPPKRKVSGAAKKDDDALHGGVASDGDDAPVKVDKGQQQRPVSVEGAISKTVSVIPPLDELPEGAAPVYDQLINYPRAKARGARHCVMCGRAPAPDAKEEAEALAAAAASEAAAAAAAPAAAAGETPTTTAQVATPAQDAEAPAATDAAVAAASAAPPTTPTPGVVEPLPPPPINDMPGAVIPKQNKDVCRECDKATWQHNAVGCYFKWCKGCKRFRNLVAFKGKLAASKW